MRKYIIHLFAIILLLSACADKRVSDKLDSIDSLIIKCQFDSASVILNNLYSLSMKEEDQAHYNLLLTQIGFIT